MRSTRFTTLFALVLLTALAAAACAPGLAGTGGDGLPVVANSQETAQAQGGTTGQFVEVTPMSQKELAQQGRGSSGPGAASGGSSAEPGAPDTQGVQPGPLVDFTDPAYKFSVSVPDNYTVDTLTADKLAAFQPKPAGVFRILNPMLAGSDNPELEAPDLEIRVFEAPQQMVSVESWLAANGLPPAKPWKNGHVSGLEVCAGTLIGPGCSYFVTGNGWVYQLTPASLEGETLMGTFTLVQ